MTSAALASSVAVFAQSRPTPRTMSVDELQPGMRGYGLTVFHGTQPERFDVEVVDVLHQARPSMDMVLVRCTHPVLEVAGTVAGMSGSPIYINDRLIGAYAYGWEFGRGTISGVTPIANMLRELHRPRHTPAGLLPGSQVPIPLGGTPPPGAHRRASLDLLGERMARARTPVDTAFGQMVPLGVPLSIAGMGDASFRYLADALEPFGMLPLQAGGTGGGAHRDRHAPAAHYVNGGSVSVNLLSGDISGASTGTVTLVDGNDVLAFGHPMLGLGEIALPAGLSRVVWVQTSTRRSTKMAEPVADLGALQNDRPFAIVLDEHGSAPTVPVHIALHGETGAPQTDWNVRVAYQRTLMPRLVSAVIGTVLETAVGQNGDVAWVVRSNIVTHDHGTLALLDYGASADGTTALSPAGLSTNDALDRLGDNAFEQVRVDRVEVDVELHWARDFQYIRSVALARAEADPGETVPLLVTLARYGAPPEVRTVPLVVPREVAGRDVDIDVGAGGETVPDLAEPESIGDLLHNLATYYADDALVITMRMPGVGVTLRGRALPDLPGSALDALRPAVDTGGGEPFANVRRTLVPIGRLLLGHDHVRLHVREIRQ